ncbi:MAG: four helix bundle protein [Planctomycetes bacterium]|nr:four helix bundle protein [Planctomycetota bacterium]MBM4082640.1 four helix bundle protein [Planctomycetota bacterium]MBM4087260.1 four helix bundle protein [Planctomycetota bacterium]
MDERAFKERTKKFALRVIRLVEALPRGRTADVLGGQLLRSGTSVGANYRAACRAKSRAHVLSKLGDVEEEADESMYWMELIAEAKLMEPARMAALMREADEIIAMTVATIRTLRNRP